MDILDYMRPYLKVKTLGSAFELGVIDRLYAAGEGLAVDRICSELSLHRRGCLALLRFLAVHGVVQLEADNARLTPSFEADYRLYGPAVRQITSYMNMAYHDLERLSSMVKSGEATGRVHEFWRYGGDRATSAEHGTLLRTVTEMQAGAIVESLRLLGSESLVDLGGNDGEFALQLCRRYDGLRCAVFDLDVVCERGETRIRSLPESSRIDFHPGDFRSDELPGRPDVVIAKSVLNDWQDTDVRMILARIYRALTEGGRLLVIEHMSDGEPDEDALLFDLVFMYLIGPAGRFRSSGEYERLLGEVGFAEVDSRSAGFLSFRVVEGRKAPGGRRD